MKTLSKKNIWQLLMLIIVAALSFDIIPAWVSPLRKEWVLLVVAFIAIIIYYPNQLLEGFLFPIWVFYCFAVFLRVALGSPVFPNYSIAIYEVLMIFVSVFLPLTIISIKDFNFIKSLLLVSFFFLIINTIGSYFLLNMYPGAIRTMHVFIEQEGENAAYDLFRFGLVNYVFCHGLPILAPPLIYLLKTYKKQNGLRLLFAISLVLCGALIWMSESTTAILLFIIMTLLGFITRPSKDNGGVIIVFILVIPFAISETLQLGALDLLGSLLGSDSSSAAKINEIQNSIIYGEQSGDLEGRMDRYSVSLKMFFSSPLWGSEGLPGRHSALLDRLAVLGIFGIIPIVMFFTVYFKKIYYLVPKEARLFLIEAVFAGFTMLFSKSMWLWQVFFCLCIFMPFLFLYNFDKTKK